MPKIEAEQPLIPSVLDRLLDEDPQATRDPPKARGQVLREMKQGLRRDLENLLNTRWRCTAPPEDLEELELSLINYGLPDITGAAGGYARDRERFRQMLQKVLERFEPRFTSVSVEMLDNTEPLDRTLRFRIDAMLEAEPAPQPIVFDSALQPTTGTVEIKGTGR